MGRADNSRVHPEPFNPNSRLRASDADREQAADVLNTALAEGRLSVTEHSDRLDAVYDAKTHAEIAPLIADLPAAASTPSPARRADSVPADPAAPADHRDLRRGVAEGAVERRAQDGRGDDLRRRVARLP